MTFKTIAIIPALLIAFPLYAMASGPGDTAKTKDKSKKQATSKAHEPAKSQSSSAGGQTGSQASKTTERQRTIEKLNKSVKDTEKDRNKRSRAETAIKINKPVQGIITRVD